MIDVVAQITKCSNERVNSYLDELKNVVWSSSLSNTRTIQIAKCPPRVTILPIWQLPGNLVPRVFKIAWVSGVSGGRGRGNRRAKKGESERRETFSPPPPPLPPSNISLPLWRGPWERSCSLRCHVSNCRVTQSLEIQAYPITNQGTLSKCKFAKIKVFSCYYTSWK